MTLLVVKTSEGRCESQLMHIWEDNTGKETDTREGIVSRRIGMKDFHDVTIITTHFSADQHSMTKCQTINPCPLLMTSCTDKCMKMTAITEERERAQ